MDEAIAGLTLGEPATKRLQDRAEWIDSLRDFGILLVVLGHVSLPPDVAQAPVWIPYAAVFVISGFLFKQKEEIHEFLVKLLKRYLKRIYYLCGL